MAKFIVLLGLPLPLFIQATRSTVLSAAYSGIYRAAMPATKFLILVSKAQIVYDVSECPYIIIVNVIFIAARSGAIARAADSAPPSR